MARAELQSALSGLMDVFGVAATYTAPGGGAAVNVSARVVELPGDLPAQLDGLIKINDRYATVVLKLSEVAAPAVDGAVTVGADVWTIVKPPQKKQAWQWVCVCRLASRKSTGEKRLEV